MVVIGKLFVYFAVIVVVRDDVISSKVVGEGLHFILCGGGGGGHGGLKKLQKTCTENNGRVICVQKCSVMVPRFGRQLHTQTQQTFGANMSCHIYNFTAGLITELFSTSAGRRIAGARLASFFFFRAIASQAAGFNIAHLQLRVLVA